MMDLIKIAGCILIIAIIFYLQGCITVNVNVDQRKLLTTPDYYEDVVPGDDAPLEVLPEA